MAVGAMGMMRSFFMVTRLVMLGGMHMMFGGFAVMFNCVFDSLPVFG